MVTIRIVQLLLKAVKVGKKENNKWKAANCHLEALSESQDISIVTFKGFSSPKAAGQKILKIRDVRMAEMQKTRCTDLMAPQCKKKLPDGERVGPETLGGDICLAETENIGSQIA